MEHLGQCNLLGAFVEDEMKLRKTKTMMISLMAGTLDVPMLQTIMNKVSSSSLSLCLPII